MRLLERHVNTEMDSDSRGGGYPRRGGGVELDGSANVFIIRFSLKALVNLNSTVGVSAAQYQEKLGRRVFFCVYVYLSIICACSEQPHSIHGAFASLMGQQC